MATPLKKDLNQEQELTTADLAQGGKVPESSGPKPVASERGVTEITRAKNQNAGATRSFQTTNLKTSIRDGRRFRPPLWTNREKRSNRLMASLLPQ